MAAITASEVSLVDIIDPPQMSRAGITFISKRVTISKLADPPLKALNRAAWVGCSLVHVDDAAVPTEDDFIVDDVVGTIAMAASKVVIAPVADALRSAGDS